MDRNHLYRIKNRLEYNALILSLIDQRRAETGCQSIGGSIERAILSRELQELEELEQSGRPVSKRLF